MTDKPSGRLAYPHNDASRAALRLSLSDERFGRYLVEAKQDEDLAVRLYTWNTALAAAFYGPLQACEVTLRNAVNRQLAARYGSWWFRNDTILRGDELRMASKAEETITVIGKQLTAGRVVAELGFGYWVGLFANIYDQSLWRSDLFKIFRVRVQRRDLFDQLDRLRTLRNRVAHHEPIFQRNLSDDFDRIDSVLDVLSPEVRDWMRHHSRVYEVLALSPTEVEHF